MPSLLKIMEKTVIINSKSAIKTDYAHNLCQSQYLCFLNY